MNLQSNLNIIIRSNICAVVFLLVACGGANEKDAKQLLERGLVDPNSVQYRGVNSFIDGTVCGEFNAKNRVGGYVGFEPFVYFRGKLRSTTKYMTILCSNDKSKEEVIRLVDPTFTTTKDRDVCMAKAKTTQGNEIKSTADLRSDEARKLTSCPPVTEGF